MEQTKKRTNNSVDFYHAFSFWPSYRFVWVYMCICVCLCVCVQSFICVVNLSGDFTKVCYGCRLNGCRIWSDYTKDSIVELSLREEGVEKTTWKMRILSMYCWTSTKYVPREPDIFKLHRIREWRENVSTWTLHQWKNDLCLCLWAWVWRMFVCLFLWLSFTLLLIEWTESN